MRKNSKSETGTWDTGKPDSNLPALARTGMLKPCSALDIGCGTGNESIFLAEKGFDVVGADISANAVKKARLKATKTGADCKFIAADILHTRINGKFGFIFDRGCFHFLDTTEQKTYARKIAKISEQSALFLLIVSAIGDTAKGPDRFTRAKLEKIFGNYFELLKVRKIRLKRHKENPLSLITIWKRR